MRLAGQLAQKKTHSVLLQGAMPKFVNLLPYGLYFSGGLCYNMIRVFMLLNKAPHNRRMYLFEKAGSRND
jgi:hypothetical protein